MNQKLRLDQLDPTNPADAPRVVEIFMASKGSWVALPMVFLRTTDEFLAAMVKECNRERIDLHWYQDATTLTCRGGVTEREVTFPKLRLVKG